MLRRGIYVETRENCKKSYKAAHCSKGTYLLPTISRKKKRIRKKENMLASMKVFLFSHFVIKNYGVICFSCCAYNRKVFHWMLKRIRNKYHVVYFCNKYNKRIGLNWATNGISFRVLHKWYEFSQFKFILYEVLST